MKNFASNVILSILCSFGAATSATANTFDTLITVDNAFMLYTGDANSVTSFVYGEQANNATGIFLVENFSFTLPSNGYIYIAAWSDDASHQGVMTRMTSTANTIRSNDPAWEVFSTGINKNPLPNQTTDETMLSLSELPLASVNAQIATANSTNAWEAPAVSTPNPGYIGSVPIGGGFDGTDYWMWHDLGGLTGSGPFQSNTTSAYEYLIFRIPVDVIVNEPDPNPVVPVPGAMLAGLAFGGCAMLRRRRIQH